MPTTIHRRSLLIVLAMSLLVVAPAPAGVAAGPVDVRLRPLGPTTVPQGAPFTVRATLSNSDPVPADVSLSLELVDVAGGGASVGAFNWEATVPGQGSISNRAPLVSAQWFTDQGTFEVRALINGQQAGNVLDYEVTAPTVDVPTFVDVTGQSGLDATLGPSTCGAWAAGAAWGDIDGDGDPDLYLPRGTEPSLLWINDGTGLFTEQAAARGVADGGENAIGAVFADYDNDGDQDLFVANGGPDLLFQNDGTGHFTDVAAAAGVAGSTHDVSASWGDYDNDGYLDLYVVSNSPCLPPDFYEQDHLFHNEGDGTFTDQTSLLSAGSTFGAGYQAAWFDYDGDGDQDLYLANDRWGPDPDRNHLWRNDGGSFTDVSIQSYAGYLINSMGIGIGDVDGDLDLDLAVSNIGGNVLASNNGDGTFTNLALRLGVERDLQQIGVDAITWGLVFADLNLDGWEDLFAAAGAISDEPVQPDEMFTGAGDGTFLDLSALSGTADLASGRGVAVADYDRDGLPDLYVVNRNGSPLLYRNVTVTSSHWLEVDLTGTASNRDGCGARLIVTTGSERQVREAFCGSVGVSSGSDTVIHFGLGTATRADRLVVLWPSGRRQVLKNLAVDRLLDVVEPA